MSAISSTLPRSSYVILLRHILKTILFFRVVIYFLDFNQLNKRRQAFRVSRFLGAIFFLLNSVKYV